jgi:membrane fusion protein, multidrug efflux system
VILVGVAALAAAGLGVWLFTHRGLESTDDAQVDGEVVAVAPRTGGVVFKVNFNDNERVEKGRVLVELDPEAAKAMLAQAEASLEGAKAAAAAAATDALLATTNAKATNHAASASLSAASAGASSSRDQIVEARTRVTSTELARAQAKTDLERITRLVTTGSLPQAQLESAKTAFDTAEANVAQAHAHLSGLEASAAQAMSHVGEASAKVEQTRDIDSVVALAEARSRGARARVAELEAARDRAALELSYTKIVAAQDGIASKKNIAVGQTIAAGSPFAQLVSMKEVWVTANFKETQVNEMRVGQSVELRVDALSGPALHGTVESFSAATGSRFALLPPDNASGNFTKVVQRVPVRIRIDGAPQALALRPGMSVELTVNTRK